MNGNYTKDERTMAMLCHLLTFVAGFIGPLIIWLVKKEESPFVDDHGKAALNFQISLFIYMMISVVLMLVIVGIFTAMALGLLSVVCTIIAAVRAHNGEHYKYPLAIRFLK